MTYTTSLETALAQKLKGFRSRVPASNPNQQRSHRDPRPSPLLWKGDGVDHINIWTGAETELGRVLAHGAKVPFVHPLFDRFNCVESFWHYVATEEHDDRIRHMNGKALQEFASVMTKLRVPNFRAIIMHANWLKVSQYSEIEHEIKESVLPFDCYYINKRDSNIPIRTNFASWVIDGFEEIRKAVIAGREPSFKFLMDSNDTDMFEKLLASMRKAGTTADINVKFDSGPIVRTDDVDRDTRDKPSALTGTYPIFAAVDHGADSGSVATITDGVVTSVTTDE